MKFGDIVKFSPEWFQSNQIQNQNESWVKRTREARMVVILQKGELVTLAKKGTHYLQTYHEDFLEEAK